MFVVNFSKPKMLTHGHETIKGFVFSLHQINCDKHRKTAGSPERLIPNSRKSWQPNLSIFGE